MLNEINLARVDLNLLALFEVIFAERHVGRAAARLNLTASAVSPVRAATASRSGPSFPP